MDVLFTASDLLVMVSSELVVLLIVCVGINTGLAQDPGELVQQQAIIYRLEYLITLTKSI